MPETRGEPALHGWIARAVVVLAAVATFARGVGGPLVESWDDRRFLVDNLDVQRVSWSAFASIWSRPHFEAYHPLHLLSYWLDVPWAGPSGPVLHAVSLALWCGVLLVVLALFRRLGLGLVASVIATLFFGLHAVQVEAVTWATGRKEIVAIGLASASALAHLGSERWSDRRAWLSRALYVLAALAKTTVLPLPLVLFAADVLLRRRDPKTAAIAQAPAIVLGAALGAVVIAIWSGHEMIRDAEGRDGSIALVLATYSHYLATALWPASTSPVYPLARDEAPNLALAVIGVGALAGALAFAWRKREDVTARRVLFGLIAFVVLLAPVSNAVPLYFQWADRYLALPLIGLAFALGALIEAARGRRAVLALAGALVIALVTRTVAYQGAWASDLALWQHAAAVQPRAFYAWLKLGEVRRDAGRYDAALRAYREATEIAPRLRLGHGAFMSALLLRDEQRHGIAPSRALELAQRFAVQMHDALALRELAGEMANAGYRDGVTHALARALDLEPLGDDRLERAAAIQLARGEEWLARFYISRLQREPVMPPVQAYMRRERERSATISAPPEDATRPDTTPR